MFYRDSLVATAQQNNYWSAENLSWVHRCPTSPLSHLPFSILLFCLSFYPKPQMYCKQNSIFFAKTGSGTHLLKRILLVVSRRGSLQVPSASMAECKIEVRGNKSVHSALSNDWSSRASIYLKCLPSHSPGSKQKLEPNRAFTLPSNMEIYAQTPNDPEGEELQIHFVEECAVQSPGGRHQSHGREMWWMQTLFQPAPKQGRCASSTAWWGCWALGSIPSTWHR